MSRPYALLRAGFPYLTTIGVRRNQNVTHPTDIAFGKNGEIYIVCQMHISQNTGIVVLNINDDCLDFFSLQGSDFGQARFPECILIDDNETLYISDSALHRITLLSKKGEYISHWGEFGSKEGQLNRPSGMSFDSTGNIYISDTMNHRVQKFTKNGEFIGAIGGFGSKEGEMNMPFGIKIDELDYLYVADWRNDRIQKFDSDGKFVFSIGQSGNGLGEFNRPSGVDVDSDGDIYIADTMNNRVQLFNEKGRYVQRFLGDATLSKSAVDLMQVQSLPLRLRDAADLEDQKWLTHPRTVKINSEGMMFVPDYHRYRVQIYKKEAYHLKESQLAPEQRSPKLKTV